MGDKPKIPRRTGLVYYPDDRPGIRRERRGRGFSYLGPDGARIGDAAERARLNALAVPPAYEEVWISPRANGHLLATGQDERARKQYLYHPDWTAFRALKKFDRLVDFAALLPRIRRRYRRDLKAEPGERAFALAAVLAVIDRYAMRVGTPKYAEENDAYGATTLRSRHLNLTRGEAVLRYGAKGGQTVERVLKDAAIHDLFETADDLPGAELFTYEGEDGEWRPVRSEQVNDYLEEAGGSGGFTAKTFRTWQGTVAAFDVARKTEERLTVKAMAEAAAARLHNTPAIARTSYIHPAVIALAEEGDEARVKALDALKVPKTRGLRVAERATAAFLKARAG